jgi:MFS family permease
LRFKLFYGWYIVAAALVMSAYYSALYVYGFTAFVNPILSTFGWSMTQLSLASSWRGLETGVFNPLWGTAVDRYSPRKLLLIGVVITALGMFVLSRTTNLAIYYIGFLIDGVGSSLVTGMIPMTVMAKWFRKDIGKANGVFSLGMALGGVLVPVVVILIGKLGWQNTLLAGAIGFLALGVPLSFLFRARPEPYGMVADGRTAEPVKGSKPAPNYDFGTKVRQAVKMRAFWHLTVVIMFQAAYLAPLQTFTLPYLSSLGMERSTAATVITVYTSLSLVFRIPMGLLGDIMRKGHVVAISVGLETAGLVVFWLMGASTPFWLILLFGLTYGIGIAGIMPLRAPVLAEYFGNRNLGSILGLTSAVITISAVASTPLAGWVWDTYHDYKPFWMAGIILGILALVAILTIPSPPKRGKPELTSDGTVG